MPKPHTFTMSEKPAISELLSCNLKRLRKERNLTQEQLAEKAGISVRHLSDIERSDSFPSPEVIEQIAKQFKVPSYTLFLPEEECRDQVLFSQKYGNLLQEEVIKALERVTIRIKEGQ